MTDHVDTATLALFREDLLDEGQAALVRAHLSGCPHCRQVEAQFSLVTDLLASTPAPPMPPALSARIEAALAAEATARAAGPAGVPAPALPGTAVPDAAVPGAAVPGAEVPGSAPAAVPGAAPAGAPQPVPGGRGTRPPRRSGAGTGPGAGRPPQRTRRPLAGSRARLRIMAAAAAVVVVGGGGYAVAQYAALGGPASSGSSAARSQPRPASPVAGPIAGMGPNNASGTAAGRAAVSAVASGTDYTARQFTSQVRAVLTRYPASGVSRRPAAGERALPSSGLGSCVSAVTGGRRPRLVDVARYQGRQAMIIVVAGTATAPARAWVVGLDCSATRHDVLARVSLPGLG